MVIISTVKGDLLKAKEKYIAQQCNCNTLKAHGLSKVIADTYPWANPYALREGKSANSALHPDTPGTVTVLKNLETEPIFLCLMAQWAPGKAGGKFGRYYPKTYQDTVENRKLWFQQCLVVLDEMKLGNDAVVAMPFRIGCGMAGGNWKEYKLLLEKCQTKIVLYLL